jgi:CDP-paratose 2-epimerase
MTAILVTGGAGFVGSSLALRLRQARQGARVLALDNLKRRGSELALDRLRQGGVEFVHGDVRQRADLLALPKVDLVVDCAAEPSVLAGLDGSPDYVIDSNLGGTLNVLELARRDGAELLFLSTSRVYPFDRVNELRCDETATRFVLRDDQALPGASARGIAEGFPLDGPRSLYGASKLASELLIAEYVAAYGLRAVIDRCGVLSGPWQMGKVDQGVVVLWAACHVYGRPLSYLGWGGTGRQVRDVLFVDDLWELVERQLAMLPQLSGRTFNVGGGPGCSLSLCELTELCRTVTGRRVEIAASAANRPQDVRCYLTDTRLVEATTGWRPRTPPATILEHVVRWILDHRDRLEPVLAS